MKAHPPQDKNGKENGDLIDAESDFIAIKRPPIRKEAPDKVATITPAAARGNVLQLTLAVALERLAFGVGGFWLALLE